VLPDVPPIAQFLPGYEASTWFGIGVLRGTPPQIAERLSTTINAALRDPTFTDRLTNLGGTALNGSADDFRAFVIAEIQKWAKVIRAANLTAE